MNRPVPNRMLVQLLFLLLVLLPVMVFAADRGTLNLQKPASFDKGLDVPDAVKSDCQIDTKIIDFIEFFAEQDFDKIALVENVSASTPGRALSITIKDLSGAGGGAWSGPKHLTIEGTLWQDGKMIGNFTANRVTSGGALGAYRGTCSLLARCAKTLGKDVACWLQKPTMNATLGDAK